MITPDLEDVQRAVGTRYEVLNHVGTGGGGSVFRARHRELGHFVAIKVLPPEIAASEMRQERFRREAELAAHLSHPNVVQVFDFEPGEKLPYLVMLFVRGGRSLDKLLGERPQLPLWELLRILQDVGAALDFIHPRGVVHRDVKPANIMIEEETDRALLADFGVALAGVSGGSLTGPLGVVGTPGYIPPEALTGAQRVDGRADLYALALVAFEALTGDLPTAGLDRAALASALRKRRRDVSPALAAALVAPLAERPSERPETAAVWLHGIGRSTSRSWRGPVLAAAAFALLSIAAWIAWRRLATHPTTQRSITVMPFVMLGSNRDISPAQLPTFFQNRLPPVPKLTMISSAKAGSLAGEQAVFSDARAAAAQLGATYFVMPSLELQGSRARMSARLYATNTGKQQKQSSEVSGPVDSLSEIMDAVWAQLLTPIVRGNFAPVSNVTMPRGLAALVAYANAEEAFRVGDYSAALDEYNRVIAADSSFAIGYFRRALVIAQVDPREESLRAALAGAQRHQPGLAPADSLMLEGYRLLLERGDGRAALAQFKLAATLAPDQPLLWFVLAEVSYHFGLLFDQKPLEAEASFDTVLALSPNFAPAVADLISFAVSRNDRDAMEHLIHQYEGFGTPSVVTETVGIVDTLLLHGLTAKVALQKTLLSHSFTALEYLAFQVQIFGTPEQRRGPGRDVLRALERRAATDSERVLALRFGVAADLGEGWVDSARARLARTDTPATMRERDMWLVLSHVTGIDSLGDWRSAAERLAAQVAAERRGGELVHWMLARLGHDRARHVAALDRLAADSAPLPRALRLDLDARRSLAARDSASALDLWRAAIERYAVLRVPFDLAASLWWLRRDLAQLARAQGDTALAAHTCDSFASIIGYVDLPVQRHAGQFCPPGTAN